MTRHFAALLAATACLIPAMSAAGPCEDLAKLALKTGGKWQAVEELPARSVARDGPWYAGEDLYGEDNAHRPSGFIPQPFQTDRQRILKEVGQVDPAARALVSAYLSPSAKAFEAAMEPVAENTDSGDLTVRVHRWPKTNLFAVSAHDNAWYQCQREVALFYTGADGKIHYASSEGLSDCTGRSDPGTFAQPVAVRGEFGFMDEVPNDWSVTGEPGMRQEISLWTGDRLAAMCPLAYYYQIGYRLSRDKGQVDGQGRPRPGNALDAYLKSSFQEWMPVYVKARHAQRTRPSTRSYSKDEETAYNSQLDALKDFAGKNTGAFITLKAAYDGIITDHRVSHFDIIHPLRRGQALYLLTFDQDSSTAGGVYPYIDLVLYSVDGNPPRRLANIGVDRIVGKLTTVKVEARGNR